MIDEATSSVRLDPCPAPQTAISHRAVASWVKSVNVMAISSPFRSLPEKGAPSKFLPSDCLPVASLLFPT